MHWAERTKVEAEMRKVANAVRNDPEVTRVLTELEKDQRFDIHASPSLSQVLERPIRQNQDLERNSKTDRER